MTEQNKSVLIQGTATVDYQTLKALEAKAAAFDALDPENAVAGVNIGLKAREIFTIESQDNGEGVISADRDKLYEFIKDVTGVKPIGIKITSSGNGLTGVVANI